MLTECLVLIVLIAVIIGVVLGLVVLPDVCGFSYECPSFHTVLLLTFLRTMMTAMTVTRMSDIPAFTLCIQYSAFLMSEPSQAPVTMLYR